MGPLARTVLAWTPATVLALTVFAFASGMSSIPEVAETALTGRWVMLFMLLGVGILTVAVRVRASERFSFPAYLVLPFVVAGLAALSTAWSVDPSLTFKRAASFGILFTAAACLAYGAAGDERGLTRLLVGIVAAALAVAVVGAALLIADSPFAAQEAGPETGWRFRGYGLNPNTAPMLYAIAIPLAIWFTVRGRSMHWRLLAGGALLLFGASVVASQSRGGLLATLIGATVALVLVRGVMMRLAAVAVAAGILAAGLALRDHLQPTVAPVGPRSEFITSAPTGEQAPPAEPQGQTGGPGESQAAPGTQPQGETRDETARFPLFRGVTPVRRVDEIGHGLFAARTSRAGSGRLAAWEGTLELVGERPLLGYGFGTESTVFVDRWYYFQGINPENAYLGLLLQLGVGGLGIFAAFIAALVGAVVRTLRRYGLEGHEMTLALAGSLGAGLALMLAQSYVYSVGNIATVAFWTCVFALVVAAAEPAVERERVPLTSRLVPASEHAGVLP
jgi:O-antigen ligase